MAQLKKDDEPRPFTVSMESKEIPCNRTGEGPVQLIFTHGAGGTITSDGIANFSAGFSRSTKSSIICFQGNMNLKSRVKMFDAVHDNAINTYKHKTPIALGGRSMGARAAVLAAIKDTECLILASYPLQNNSQVRDQILLDLPAIKNVLFISGDHDTMCDLDKLKEVRQKMKAKTWLIRVRDADHGMNLKPKKASKVVGEECGVLAEEWLHTRIESETEREVWWGVDDQGTEAVHSGTWRRATEPELKKNSKRKPEEEIPGTLSKAGKTRSTEGSSKPRKETKARSASTKKGPSNSKSSEDKQEAVNVSQPAAGLRRSKRKKVEG